MKTTFSISVFICLFFFTSCVSNNSEEDSLTKQTDRYCFTLDLKADDKLIAEYKHIHTPNEMWLEIPEGISEAGCLDMEIYLVHNRMFLIVDIATGANIDSVWTEMGQQDRQDEWASFVRKFQQAIPQEDESSSWILMEKVYDLDDYFSETNKD